MNYYSVVVNSVVLRVIDEYYLTLRIVLDKHSLQLEVNGVDCTSKTLRRMLC